MRDPIEPATARARRNERSRSFADIRALVAAVVLLPLLSAACQPAVPSPSTGPPAISPATFPAAAATAASPASPASPATTASPSALASSGPGTSVEPRASSIASRGSDAAVFITLVELAAEDPSPGGTFIVIENRGATPADIGCWRLSTTTREDLRIPAGSTVPAGKGLRLFFERGAVANPDRLELRDDTGHVIDGTTVLDDTAADDQLFGRVGDGWVFGRPPLASPLVDGGFIGPGGC